MLNLSSITHLDLVYQDLGMDAKKSLSDVIRSLSTTIADQSEQYIQKYISLQTFGNDGEESTSEIRRFNATATLIQAYNSISVKDPLQKCREITQEQTNSIIGFKIGDARYAFGFNGREVFYQVDDNLGRDLLTTTPLFTFAHPNSSIIDDQASGAVVSRDFCCCSRLLSTTFQQNGLGSTNEQRYWIDFNQELSHNSNGYYVPVRVIKDDRYNHQTHIFEATPQYVSDENYGKALIAAMDGLYRNLQTDLQSTIALLYHSYFTEIGSADSITPMSSGYLMKFSGRYTQLLPRFDNTDLILNTKLGHEALNWENLPHDIVNWIERNS